MYLKRKSKSARERMGESLNVFLMRFAWQGTGIDVQSFFIICTMLSWFAYSGVFPLLIPILKV